MEVFDGYTYYSDEEIIELLTRAEELGFSLDRESELEKLTLRELDILVNKVQ